jgi:hypothetical protein
MIAAFFQDSKTQNQTTYDDLHKNVWLTFFQLQLDIYHPVFHCLLSVFVNIFISSSVSDQLTMQKA